ncbi:MAG: type II secretion system F family protein [Ktedonobacterales bacterium]|nr:type II secretion system F family protein [Ktedonobacterales bacterium]
MNGSPDLHLPLVVSLMAALAVFILFLGFSREWRKRHQRMDARLRQLDALRRGMVEEAVQAIPAEGRGQLVTALNTMGTRMGLADQLARAGINLTAGEYLLIIGLLIVVGLVMCVALHNVLLFLLVLVAGFFGPRWWIETRRTKRTRNLEAQLPGTVVILINAVRASGAVPKALAMAARQTQPPMSKEMGLVVESIEWGTGVRQALLAMTARIESIDLQLLVTAIVIQQETGGDLVQMLERISETIRERVRLQGEVRSLTAQQRYSGYVVALLPAVIGCFLMVVNPNYILGVFQSTVWCGWVMFVTAGVMVVIGTIVIQKVVDIKV